MSSQVAVRQGRSVGVAAGRVQQTQYEIKEAGITVSIGKGCFERTNFIIKNTQGSVKLRRYWYFRHLIRLFLLYCFVGLLAFLHVGAAGAVMFIDLLWIALFSQYIHIVRKVMPIVLLHPVISAIAPDINQIFQINRVSVEGRYVCAVANQSAGVQVGNIDLQYDEVESAGLIQVTAASNSFKIQVVSPQARGQMRQTRPFSFMLLFTAIFHFMYALGMLIMILIVSDGKPSLFFDD